ncbi:MAG TPA: arylsulfatase, partial [Acidimicrobiales bacterium]
MTAGGAETTRPVIGRTIRESTPWFAPRPKPPAGAPNVVVVLLDDTGFAHLGPYGSDVETPTVDRLAAEGLRYTRFHVTALCSPSRASLLTGRNHHAVGMGFLCDMPTGFPGYTTRLPRSAATLARILRDAGYSTLAVGKWHLTPRGDRTASGPFDTWPLGVGFERYYGFLHGDANHWTPTLVADNHYVEPPRRPEDGYHLSEDLVDTALRFVVDQQHATPGKPFLLYLAPGATHAPHHVAPGWADRYRGRFDDGWERARERAFARQVGASILPEGTTLPPRPPWIQAWDDLPADERRLYARFQEVFAGFLTHLDAQLGRLVAGLEELGVLDDTLVVLLSDNGASAEGGRVGTVNEHRFGFGYAEDLAENLAAIDDLGGWRSYNHYPWGWAWAGNAPFRLWKRYTWLGGTRAPLVVRYPREVADPGGLRRQFCHVVDLFPTILDACGVPAPEVVDGVAQQPVDGASLRPT